MRIQNFFFIILSITTLNFKLGTYDCTAQTTENIYEQALQLKLEYKYQEALPIFQALVESDSNNLNYLQCASYCYSKYGFYYAPEEAKIKYYSTAIYLARKALKISESSADAHLAYAMALGRIITENESSKEKIVNAKLIKEEADRALALNPDLAGAYHILGCWNRAVAGFSAIEKAMINSLYGGVIPNGSYEDAINAFMMAIRIEPKFMNHQYELAETYYRMGKRVEVKFWIKKTLEIIPTNADDISAKKGCEALLKKLN